MFRRLHFVKMLKIEKVIEILKCDPCRATPVIETDFLQHFFSINITKNSHPFLIFQRLNFDKTFKFEKITEI